jgi:hypothetical protein
MKKPSQRDAGTGSLSNHLIPKELNHGRRPGDTAVTFADVSKAEADGLLSQTGDKRIYEHRM